jgi:hypothetical protein
MVAWLVTWEIMGDGNEIKNPTAAILNYRLPAKKVREIVELIYVNTHFSLSERLAYARNKKSSPYLAKYDTIHGVPWQGGIVCGHNPWLHARLVDKLTLKIDKNGQEILTWKERNKPNPAWLKSEMQATDKNNL